jgi:hypothetical protein
MDPITETTTPRRPDAGRRTRRPPVLAALAVALGFGLLQAGGTAHAERFGTPWAAEVVAERTIAYTKPDRSSPPSGPLGKGAIVVVLEDPGEWTHTHVGFVPTADTREKDDPWAAEVIVDSVSIYAKPNAGGEVRRTARRGALLRVTGVSPGLEGDSGTWWATTEGYVSLDSIQAADRNDKWVQAWAVPGDDEATRGWWGEVSAEANVRAGPTTEAPIVGEFAGGERVKVLAEEDGLNVAGSPTWYRIDGGRFAGARLHSSLVRRIEQPKPTVAAPPDATEPVVGTSVVVDRRAQTLTLLRDGQPQFATYVALGKAGKETPAGGYSSFAKFRADDMTSKSVPDAERPYDLPNVPFAQYYKEGGLAIHGTYWHDLFGTDQSQGCINLTWADAAYLFGQTKPEVPADERERWAPPQQATPVIIVG